MTLTLKSICTLAAISIFILLSGLSINAKQKTNIPILKASVLCAHGSFHSYSLMPSKGDKLVLNVKKLQASKPSMLSFIPQRKVSGPNPYVPVVAPFKLQSPETINKYSYRLLSQDNRAGGSSVTIDLHRPRSGSKKWSIFIIYESRGINEGIAVLEAIAIK